MYSKCNPDVHPADLVFFGDWDVQKCTEMYIYIHLCTFVLLQIWKNNDFFCCCCCKLEINVHPVYIYCTFRIHLSSDVHFRWHGCLVSYIWMIVKSRCTGKWTRKEMYANVWKCNKVQITFTYICRSTAIVKCILFLQAWNVLQMYLEMYSKMYS